MGYFIVGKEGGRFGPVEIEQLQQWAQQGRVVADTVLEDADTRHRLKAAEVPLLGFPPPASRAAKAERPSDPARSMWAHPLSADGSSPWTRGMMSVLAFVAYFVIKMLIRYYLRHH